MKLKNLKTYLLIIFSIFFFNLNTQAIDINIKSPIPGNFFKNITATGNKRMIIQVILNAFNDENQFNDPDAKKKLISCFQDMQNNLDETDISDFKTFIDLKANEISQSIYIKFQNQKRFPVFFRSKTTCKPKEIEIINPIPNDFFNKIMTQDTKTTLKMLKKILPEKGYDNIENLFNELTKSQFTQIETAETCDNTQCILISNNTDFYLFYFRSSSNRNKTLKTSK